MKVLAALLLLATLVSCAGPVPEPVDEATVVEQDVCRVSRSGGPLLAERGKGGTGGASRTRVADRGIGGTGIVGVVTGFASVCVDGLEVRFDKNVPLSINGSVATARQLRVGQLVVIRTSGPVPTADPIAQAQTISVRYEVSGPIEAIDIGSGAMVVAGQRAMVLPATWTTGRLELGNWITVSGLRQSDGTIIASRLDRARTGAVSVRGRLVRDRDTTRIGGLILHGLGVETVKAGTSVSITAKYSDGSAEVTAIDADLLSEDPASYFGISAQLLIMQAFVRVEHGMVWLNNGQKFSAGPAVQGNGRLYRNAIVRLERTADGSFAATGLRYTSYRAQPKDAPSRAEGRGTADLVEPPDPPPGPPADASPADSTDRDGGNNVETGTPPAASPGDVPTSNSAPTEAEPSADVFVADQSSTLAPGAMRFLRVAARK